MTESFEAKKHAYRQTQDGIVISFTIHPNDMPEHLALAPLGTRFGVAVAEIGDDERPVPIVSGRPAAVGEREDLDEAVKSIEAKERRPFGSLPLSQQCALRCRDNDFLLYLGTSNAGHAAQKVRALCGIKSRSELDTEKNIEARDQWATLEHGFGQWLADRQYAGSIR